MDQADAPRDLLRELAQAFLERHLRGEQPSIQEYAQQYPQWADQLRALLEGILADASANSLGSTPTKPVAKPGVRPGEIPQHLGEYRILRQVGRGGMGIVYEAVQESLGRHVALKVLPFHHLIGSLHLERFRREARAAAQLHHTNIVPVFGVGEDKGIHYYAMQFIDGQSLDAVLKGVKQLRSPPGTPALTLVDEAAPGTLSIAQGLLTGELLPPAAGTTRPSAGATNALSPPDAAKEASPPSASSSGESAASTELAGHSETHYFRSVARVGMQVADALAYAHRQGILHRDIKPSNLLLDTRGTVWITDFGLAKAEGSEELTNPGDIVGTLRYMAPERFEGRADPRSDVYSLGITLYELLALQPAYSDSDRARLIERVTREEPTALRRIDPRIPRDLETIILKAMAKEPAERYPSAEALRTDLQRYLADRPVQARRSSALERTWRWCRRNPAVAVLTASVALLLVAITLVSSLAALWLREERDTAMVNWQRAERAEKEVHEEQAQTLHALQRAEAAERDAIDKLWRSYLAEARAGRWSGQSGRRFHSLETLAKAAALRPSLELRNEAIACMSLADLQPGPHWDGNLPGNTGLAFDLPLARCARGERDGQISIRRLANDQELLSLPGFGLPAVPLQFSRDGRLLVVRYDDSKSNQLRIWDLESRAVRYQTAPGEESGACDLSPDGRWFAFSRRDGSIAVEDLTMAGRRQHLPGGLQPFQVRLRPDGKQLAVSRSNSPTVHVYDLATGKAVHAFAHAGAVNGIAWSPDGKRLASACADFHVYIWDTTTGRALQAEGHQAQASQVCFSQQGDLLASLGWDSVLRLWDARTAKQLVSSQSSSWVVPQFSADDQLLGFTVEGTQIQMWQLATGQEFRTLQGHERVGKGPWTVDIHAEERLLLSGSGDGVALWDLVQGTEIAFLPVGIGRLAQEIQLDRGNSSAGLFHPSGNGLWTAGRQTLLDWPLVSATGSTSAGLRLGPPRPVRGGDLSWKRLSQSADGRVIAAVAEGGEALVFAQDKPGTEVRLGHHPGMLHVAVSPEGKYVATAPWFEAGGIKVWDAQTGKLLHHWTTGNGHVAFSPDGQWLVTGTPQEYRFWRVGSWEAGRRIPRDHAALGGPLAFSPDGTMLALAATDSIVRLIDPTTGEELATLDPSARRLLSAFCFSPKGNYLAAATENHIIQLWDLRRIRKRLATLGLDWPTPRVSPGEPTPPTAPLLVQVELGDLASPHRLGAGDPVRLRQRLALWSLQRELAPYHPEPYHQRGHLYDGLNEPERAVGEYTQALRWQPTDPKSQAHLYQARGVSHYRIKKYAETAADLERALQLRPDDATICNSLAVIYFMNLQDAGKALPLAQRAEQLVPDHAGHPFLLGLILHRLRQYQPAIDAFERAIHNNHGQATGYHLFYLAMCHSGLSNTTRANDYYSRGVQWMEEQRPRLAKDELDRLSAVRTQAEAVLAREAKK